MRRRTQLLRICVERVAVFVMLLLAAWLLAGCVSPDAIAPVPATATPLGSLPTEVPQPTSTPVPTALSFPLPAPTLVEVVQQGYQTCVQCHSDEAMLRDSMASEEEIASENEDEAWAGGLPPAERWRAVFLDDLAFLETMHGRYGCITCHGGTGNTLLKEVAHTGLIRQPGSTDLCADCHAREVSNAVNNLHASLTGYRTVLFARSKPADTAMLETVMENHCNSCHTATCGQCHVSHPAGIGGGLVAGHEFGDVEAINTTCAGCHGSRIEAEYKGQEGTGPGDVHWTQGGMLCSDCHPASEFHGTETEHLERYDGAAEPSCDDLGCHPDISAEDGIEQHGGAHLKSLSCQACHATSYRNCYGCHVAVTDDTPSFTLEAVELDFKIGRNPIKSGYRPWKYVTVRHVPVARDSFAYYGEDLLSEFNALPNWKYATPHTIQRITPQNESCNACHGNTDLFLTAGDVPADELRANWPVIVERVIGEIR
jgi:hypothetical protein